MKHIMSLLFLSAITLFAHDAFIKASDLATQLDNKSLVLIDVTDAERYSAGHIPGAVNTHISSWRQRVGLHRVLRSHKEILDEMHRLGINNDSFVVLYGHNQDKEMLKCSYIALAMTTEGFNNVSILDGGYAEWMYDFDHIVSTKEEQNINGNFKPHLDKTIVVQYDFVKKNLHKITMLDTRPTEFYFGTLRSQGVRRVGHIAGATSSYWKDKFLIDETLKPKSEIEEIFITGAGLKKDEPVMFYCTGGLEASMNWYLVHNYLGFKKAKIYDASMREWGNRDDTPIVRYKWE